MLNPNEVYFLGEDSDSFNKFEFDFSIILAEDGKFSNIKLYIYLKNYIYPLLMALYDDYNTKVELFVFLQMINLLYIFYGFSKTFYY